jgi:arginyl-tRNA synthetase
MEQTITAAIAESVKQVYDIDTTPDVTRPDAEFGDFATNVALKLAKQVGKNPRDIAAEIAENLNKDGVIATAEVAGPGFLNIRLRDSALVDGIDRANGPSARQGEVVVIETNNPNPFKDLHIGHAYNCIVADTIANLLQAGEAQVHRVSYHGDVGLHVGKSMWSILKYIDNDPTKLNEVPADQRAKFMSERYVEGAKAYKEDPEVHEQIEQLARESFNPTGAVYKQVYETCKNWSFTYIDEMVAKLGSKVVEKRYLESATDAAGVTTVREHVGDVFSESDGAVVFTGEAFGLHTRVFIASRGTGLYEARDLGLMQLKQQDFHPAKSYIVTGGEQREYFRVVIKAAELALPELNGVTQNISTGTVKLSTGKMSSREGNVLNIEWVFNTLREALVARGGSADDTDTLIGALRYTMLRVRIGSDVIFDVETALSLDGNSGPYLQYAHARACSIRGKSGRTAADLDDDVQFDPAERALAVKLSEYHEVVETAVRELLPHHVATYLYELAQEFNRFYEKSRIIDDPREELRLSLLERYTKTLAAGLELLGIPAPQKM